MQVELTAWDQFASVKIRGYRNLRCGKYDAKEGNVSRFEVLRVRVGLNTDRLLT